MAMGRRAKNRLKMFGLIFCCSSVIAALATSTMAWYAAESSITVDPSSSSVTIRTPFQYHLYAYKGNRFPTGNGWTSATYEDDPGSGYVTPNAYYSLETVTITDGVMAVPGYEEVNALKYYSNKTQQGKYVAALTNASGIWPSYKLSFAIYVTGLDGKTDQPALTIKTITNENTAKFDKKRYLYGGETLETPIYISEAIVIRAGVGATLSEAYGNKAVKDKPSGWSSGDTDTLQLGIAAAKQTSYWYYYEIEFSDAQSTYYLPCTEKGATRTTPDIVGANYYKPQHDKTGNSSVYEGLTFSITSMTLENTSA